MSWTWEGQSNIVNYPREEQVNEKSIWEAEITFDYDFNVKKIAKSRSTVKIVIMGDSPTDMWADENFRRHAFVEALSFHGRSKRSGVTVTQSRIDEAVMIKFKFLKYLGQGK